MSRAQATTLWTNLRKHGHWNSQAGDEAPFIASQALLRCLVVLNEQNVILVDGHEEASSATGEKPSNHEPTPLVLKRRNNHYEPCFFHQKSERNLWRLLVLDMTHKEKFSISQMEAQNFLDEAREQMDTQCDICKCSFPGPESLIFHSENSARCQNLKKCQCPYCGVIRQEKFSIGKVL